MSTDLNHDQVRVGDERLGIIHSGSRYMLGFGRDYYGIWEQGAPGGPSERFPASEQGREAAWRRYIELEPSSEQVRAAETATPESAEQRRKGWTRGRLIAVAAVVVVAIVAIVVSQSGNKGGKGGGGGGGGPVGKAAHVEATGAATTTGDLTQSAFTFSGFGTLYPQIEATWKGPTVTMHLLLNVPSEGANTTNENPFRVLDMTLQAAASASGSPSAGASASASPSGSPGAATGAGTKFVSLHGECQIQLTTLEEHAIAGSFDCTGIPAITSSTTTIDAKGTFSAES
jgi:hypothetical protein